MHAYNPQYMCFMKFARRRSSNLQVYEYNYILKGMYCFSMNTWLAIGYGILISVHVFLPNLENFSCICHMHGDQCWTNLLNTFECCIDAVGLLDGISPMYHMANLVKYISSVIMHSTNIIPVFVKIHAVFCFCWYLLFSPVLFFCPTIHFVLCLEVWRCGLFYFSVFDLARPKCVPMFIIIVYHVYIHPTTSIRLVLTLGTNSPLTESTW